MASEYRFYADATSLIGLAVVQRLDLLAVLPIPILVTRAVWREAVGDPTRPGVDALNQALAQGLLVVVDQGDTEAYPELGGGEATVLSAAAAAGAGVLLDERRARRLVQSDPALKASITEMTGVVGLLLLAKVRGRVAAVRPVLDSLIREHFWISPALYREALARAGEG